MKDPDWLTQQLSRRTQIVLGVVFLLFGISLFIYTLVRMIFAPKVGLEPTLY